jgi:hypothetical protein
MRRSLAISTAIGMVTLACCTGVQFARSQNEVGAPGASAPSEPKLELTPSQRSAIYKAVSKDRSKVASRQFPAEVGADVPPMIELYTLPDDVVSANPVAKFYQYTMVQDRVVLVDPTKMRVIDVIGPAQ